MSRLLAYWSYWSYSKPNNKGGGPYLSYCNIEHVGLIGRITRAGVHICHTVVFDIFDILVILCMYSSIFFIFDIFCIVHLPCILSFFGCQDSNFRTTRTSLHCNLMIFQMLEVHWMTCSHKSGHPYCRNRLLRHHSTLLLLFADQAGIQQLCCL